MKDRKDDININSDEEEKAIPKPSQAQKSLTERLFGCSYLGIMSSSKKEKEAQKEKGQEKEESALDDDEDKTSLPERYQNQGLLGKGGIGAVYKVWDTKLNRMVALKMLYVSSTNKERFLKEAKTMAQWNHPNIVRVYDLGEFSTTWFYTMELLEGQTLKDVPKAGQKGFRWVAEVFQKMAKALHYVHEKGFFHHDIKPSNIYLVDQDQEPKLLDFGLSIGTKEYMPPENSRKQEFDVRGDIYSLGVTLYEVLTGTRPFVFDELAYETCSYQAVLPPKEKNPEIPDSLAEICLKCLEKDRNKRYASAKELAEALAKYLCPDTVCEEEEGKNTNLTAIKTEKLEGGSCSIDAQADEIEDSELIQVKEIHHAEIKETIESRNLKNVTGLKAETIGPGSKIEIRIHARKVSGKLTGVNL